MKAKQIVGLLVAAVLFVGVSACGVLWRNRTESLMQQMEEKIRPEVQIPEEDFVGVIQISGTIADTGSSDYFTKVEYDHQGILNFINELIDNKQNQGLFLYIDSPGGYTYEIVELYDKLEQYKKETGRPIYAYCASYACSGGYYVAMPADQIYANQNSIVGSIGCIMSSYNYAELLTKLGVKEVNITSGTNKAMGSGGEEMTEEQRKIYQSIVDESYESFVDAVADGRQMSRDAVHKLADGRIYSAKQALELGMIDEVTGYEQCMEQVSEAFDNITFYEFGQNQDNFWSLLTEKVKTILPQSDTQAGVEFLEDARKGGLMYYADLS